MSRATIIAEAGVNHNGNVETAKEMIACAAACGADIIKFQTFVPELMVSKNAKKADYQQLATNKNESQYEMLKKLQIPVEAYDSLLDECKKYGIGFLSTPFDFASIDLLNSLGIERWKIPSGEITNLPYLMRLAKTRKPIILSTGMSSLYEVESAVNVFRQQEIMNITLLHCTTEYPAPYEEVNLKAMVEMGEHFGLPVGYSDHTAGIEISIAAAALGAAIIEKHFTLDRNMDGPDHKASLEPSQLSAMVKAIRNVENALGSGEKAPTVSEIKNMQIARKSIVAGRRISQGEIFTEENLTVKRPGTGISPMQWFQLIGKPAVRDFVEDELIEL